MVRWLDDGNIEYIDRIDNQVKIRGFRIETGEIETRLNQHLAIKNSAVVLQGEGVNKRLVAFYQLKSTDALTQLDINKEILKRHLLNFLPEYMLPSEYQLLENIPLTNNGKVDRRKLQLTNIIFDSSKNYRTAETKTQQQLALIFADILTRQKNAISINDSFFDLGGNSLLAVRLVSKINTQFKLSLPLAILFTASNIEQLADIVSNKGKQISESLVTIQSGGNKTPLFAIPGVGGTTLSLQAISDALGTQQPFYGLQIQGDESNSSAERILYDIAVSFISAIKKVQQSGPYKLMGHSFGGVLAYEIARLLINQGESIESLILLDSMVPSLLYSEQHIDDLTNLIDGCHSLANLYQIELVLNRKDLESLSESERNNYLASIFSQNGVEMSAEQFADYYKVAKVSEKAYRYYRPEAISNDIDVLLFKALNGNQSERPLAHDYGWSKFLTREPKIIKIEANHFTILDKKYAHTISANLT